MRMRTWIFAVVVALVLAINLGLVSLRIAQTGEETLRARVALASTGLRGQLELIDARLSPRAVATSPDLIDATRPTLDPTQPLGKPDERALRAAASALSPEPDLLIVATGQGAIVSRRAKAAQVIDNVSGLPLVKSGLEGTPTATFAAMDGALYRVAAARIPGNAAVVVVGMLVDDRMAAQLRSQVDADVTLLQAGKPLASSLPAEERARVARWAAAPAPGYGVLQVRLPLIGSVLSGRLPRGATRYAVRGALVPLDAGVQAALTVSASPYLGWLGRYQAFYLLGLLAFLLLSFLWGQLAGTPAVAAPEPQPARRLRTPPPPPIREPHPQPSLDVGNPVVRAAAPAPRDVPWREGEGPSGEHATPPPPFPSHRPEPVPLDLAFATAAAPAVAASAAESGGPPLAHEGDHEPAVVFADPLALHARADEHEQGVVSAAPVALPGRTDKHEPALISSAPIPLPAPDAGQRDFSFAGLLDEGRAPSEPPPALPPSPSQKSPEIAPALPGEGPVAPSKPDLGGPGHPERPAPDYFPGDEPTRIEPLSAALLDKLREKDEPEAGETERLPDSAIDAAASPATPPVSGHRMPDLDAFAIPRPGEPEMQPADAFSMRPEPEMPPADAFSMRPEPEMPPADAFSMRPEPEMPPADAFSMPPSQDPLIPAAEASAATDQHGGAAAEHSQNGQDARTAWRGESDHHPEAGHATADEQARADSGGAAQPHPQETLPLAVESENDPDEPHWQETFDRFRELKERLGEPADITFGKFSARLRKNRAELMAKHSCKGVRFAVYEKDGKAAIKASAVR